ncbi:DUF1080 domain-containing protein [Paenibacillus radicis (ex Xue et al. 2023)]|uniref:DUF1080 domain-containing protein n=1 Tax=Paenibacillus radicis (ex Xue et al. 2023) TaxID=2972489 RepID=A0ABT1YRM7_9BACL|nr:DUF1080 domain-containing protein [Paenibacillus radicis (ex Xue et al. 2023)]MCR8635829.1 DUF1080 domain-containing protein [Paenibacillus radicis (ex Xue et al. 2023)]
MPNAEDANYDHASTFATVRSLNPDAVMSYNHFMGTGAEDTANTETAAGAHYWEQEDFGSFVPYRSDPWAHSIGVMLGTNWGTTDSMPLVNLLNMISTLGAVGVTVNLAMGPDITGQFTKDQINKLQQIGNWLIPRKPYMSGALPNLDAAVSGYGGLSYVNTVGGNNTVHLLTGSKSKVALPASIDLNMTGVTAVKLAPGGTSIPFTSNGNKTTINLAGVAQDTYDTMISVEGGGVPTLFNAYFTDGTSTGWTVEAGSWSVITDAQNVKSASNKVFTNTNTTSKANAGSTSWTDYTTKVKIKIESAVGTSNQSAGFSTRYTDSNNRYNFLYHHDTKTLRIMKYVSGTGTVLATQSYTLNDGNWYNWKVEMNGSSIKWYINDALVLSTTDSSLTSGKIAIHTNNTTARFDNITVK